MKKILFSLIILTVLTAGCSSHKEKATEKLEISGIKTETINKTAVDDFYETSATVKSKNSSVVSSMIMGQVTSLLVKEGDSVRAGQLLLTIDSRETSQKAMGAKAGLNEALKGAESADQNRKLANKTYQRYENLYKENALTKQEFDEISNSKKIADIEYQRALQGVNRAKAGLGEVGVYQSYSRVTAPVSGIIVEKNIDLGSMAISGQPLLTIETASSLELVADINESMIDKIKIGSPVYIESENKNIKTEIISIIPKIDPMTRTFKVKIALAGLNSGGYAKIKIPIAKKQAMVVPQNSVVQKGQLTGVYTVDEKNIISYRLIRTGKTFGKDVEVLSGLNHGDKVVVSGMEKAVDGGVAK